MNKLLRDLDSAWRSLRRSPMVTLLATVMIAIGVGAATAMFSIVHSVLLTPLSFKEPQSLVSIIGVTAPEGVRAPFTVADFRDLREQASNLRDVGARWSIPAPLAGDQGPVEVSVGWVTPNYFSDVLEVEPLTGSGFGPEDQNSVLLDHGLWQRRFGGSLDVVGDTIVLGGESLTVIGVLPPEVDPNLPTLDGDRERIEIWRLLPDAWLEGDNRTLAWLRIAARIRPGSDLAEAQAELDVIADRIAALEPTRETGDLRFVAMTALDHLVKESRPYLAALMAAVGFLLLVACSNVANLMLARGQDRTGELAVRSALGAGRADLTRQLLAESLLIALMGGAAGLLLCDILIRLSPGFLPSALPRSDSISVSWPVLLFALGASFASALVSGTAPALRSRKIVPVLALTGRTGALGRRSRRFSQGLVASEVALALLLLLSGGHLLKNFAQLLQTHPGFRSDGVLTFSLTLSNRWNDVQEGARFTQDFLQEVRSIPGVQAAGHTNRIPLGGGIFSGNYALTEAQAKEEVRPASDFRYISPGYFAAMGTEVVSGRPFQQADAKDVVIVDRILAQQAWPGQEAVGKRIWTDGQLGQGGWARVAGVVENMRHQHVAQEGRPTIFFPDIEVRGGERLYVAARTDLPPLSIVDPIRERLLKLDPDATVANVRLMDSLVANSISPNRFAMTLVGAFAAVALIMSTAGLYAVVSHSVSRRTRELGIRIALGASAARMLRLVLGEGLRLTLIGSALGLILALLLTRLLSSLLFGISTVDPLTYVAVAVLVLVSALISCYFPARKAMRADPVEAVRTD